MENVGEMFQSLSGVGHGYFRRTEGFSRVQAVVEIAGVDAKKKPGLIIGIKFGASQEISAVQEREAIAVSKGFRGTFIGKDQERIVLMAGHSAGTPDRLYSVMDRSALVIALLDVAPVKGVQIKFSVQIVDTGTLHIFQKNRFVTVVFNADRPGNDIQVFHDSIV